MRFVHIADMHFDVPFTSLNIRPDLCEKRRLEQRSVLKKVIEYVKKENIEYLFISGDLYEHSYIRKTTIDYINNLFKEIPQTKIFISPGNHDPYTKDSFYDMYDFSENVYIFRNSRIEKYEDENVNIFGMAFTDFYLNSSPLERISIPFSNKLNILLAHLDLNGVNDKNGFSYNPVLESKLVSLGFDYCAIGHIHKKYLNRKDRICYPGSTIALGFDEQDKHGMIVGNITKENCEIEFVELDERSFQEIELDVSNIFSKEELVEKVRDLEFEDNNVYKISLIGKRNIEIDEREIARLVNNYNILKIKDNSTINIDIEELAKQENLIGYFVREVINRYNNGLCTEDELQKAIEIVLNAM